MTEEAYTSNESEYPWEYELGEEGREDVIRWRTLLSGDRTPSQGISTGTSSCRRGAVWMPIITRRSRTPSGQSDWQ